MKNDDRAVPTEALSDLPYFVSWGGKAAVLLLHEAIEYIASELSDQNVLDIGAGPGKISALFALLGANVTAIDIVPGFSVKAEREARKWDVIDRIRFVEYEGDPSILPDNTYDVIFTKSVLLYIRDLEVFLRKIEPKLRDGGRVVFLENSHGGLIDCLIRRTVHFWIKKRNYYYMNRRRIASIGRVFDLKIVRFRRNPLFTSRTPGWYLLYGSKRPSRRDGHER